MSFRIVPRDYQIAANAAIFDYFNAGKRGNPLVAMPTGTGKSVVIAMFLYSVFYRYPTERVMVLTHVKELIDQNFKKLLALWPTAPAGINSAGLGRRDTLQKILFAGIASVVSRPEQFGHVSLVLVDEAHLVSPTEATMYMTFISALRAVNPHVRVIGFTATPWRLGFGHIAEGEGTLFNDVCFDLTTLEAFNWLLEQGYLCPLVPKATDIELSLDGVHMRGGEYIASEVQKAVDKEPITRRALAEAVALGGDRRCWLNFCSGVDHAVHVAEILRELGVECEAVHSKMPTKRRDTLIEEWKAGRLRSLSNNNVLTTGIDNPMLDLINVLRPTASAVLWVQMLGRGTRPDYAPGHNLETQQGRLAAMADSAKHNCLVLDFAGNTRRLGPINDPVVPKRKGEVKGEAPVKICPQCNCYNHASARACFMCGHAFPVGAGPKVNASASTDELIRGADAPVVKELVVQHITYSAHYKAGKPASLRAAYYSGLHVFYEYVCPEHTDNFSRRKAREWLRERGWRVDYDGDMPSVAAILDHASALRVPTRVRVWVNRKPYPQVMACLYDNAEAAPAPDVEVGKPRVEAPPAPQAPAAGKAGFDYMDDDIPF